jgi:16S rRNA (guanine527-N7)-methyltransferase
MRARLEAAAATLGIAVDDAGWARLAQLVALWRRYGRAVNLVGATSEDAIAAHVEEALVTLACASRAVPLGPGTGWIDVGSGGGFPGLVVAAFTPCALHLVEPRQKRAAFLELALSTIGKQAVVSRARIDGATWNQSASEQELDWIKGPYWIATSRATFAPDAWLALGEKLVTNGGVVIAHVPRDCRDVAGRAPDVHVIGSASAALGFRVDRKHEVDPPSMRGGDVPRGT